MDTKLIIHCVGLEGLTITVSGADHSIPITADVLRVTTLPGSVEYTIPPLPVIYNTADLNGNLTISDDSGKALYRWRSHATAQAPPAGPRQPGSQPTRNRESERQFPSISAPSSYRTAETPPNSRFSRALNELNDPQDAPSEEATAQPSLVISRKHESQPICNHEREERFPSISASSSYRTTETSPNARSIRALNELDDYKDVLSEAEAMAEDPNGPRRLRSGDRRNMNYYESNLSRSSTNSTANHSTSSSPGRRSNGGSNRNLKGLHTSEDRDPELSGPNIPLAWKRRLGSISKVATTSDSDPDTSESDIAPPMKQRCKRRESPRLKDLSGRESELPVSEMPCTQKVFLRNLLDRLSRENDEDSQPFAKPVDAIAEDILNNHTVIEGSMDLPTMKENLDKGFYSSVEDFGAEFNLMIENSIRLNGMMHEVSQRGLRLLNAFYALVASVPGRN